MSRFSPLRLVDALIDSVTMYRLTLYTLLAYIGVGTVLSIAGKVGFSPVALLASTIFLVLMCWAANTLLAWVFRVPTNLESATITGLILALIIDPAKTSNNWQFLGWAAILAMASKYVLGLWKKHIFNPAAIAVLITAYVLGDSASWWVGSGSMAIVTVIGGFLLTRKIRREDLVGAFLITALLASCLASLALGMSLPLALRQLLVESPLVFFATIMLTEPLTTPPTRKLRIIYGMLVGVMFIPQAHLGSIYSTPELALCLGNLYSYAVGPKRNLALQLRRKARLSPDILEFAFRPTQRLAFEPGQYMEFTLGHPRTDSRGNRRYFTIASSPTEDQLRLGVRFYPHGSTYKQAMARLAGRTELIAGQLAGDFTLPRDPNRKLAFIAGGIGITPFRSMLKYLIDTKQARDINVIYTNRRPEDVVYHDVLTEAQIRIRTRVTYTLTDPAMVPSGWQGPQGRLDERMISSLIPDYRSRLFYLSGPPEMVRATAGTLRRLGVHNRNIKRDYFPGLS